ncbi:MAG TPA: EAL domain-containing protein [Thermomicrobiales bacterium]|nr:EAL domain-containing protein [Thermomicrobiales bacterium]
MDHHLRRSSAILYAVGLAVGLFVNNTPLGRGFNRLGINLLAVCALLSILAVWYVPWRRYHRDCFALVTGSAIAIVAVLVPWSGGWQSPFTAYYFFIVVFAALYYRPPLALALGLAVTLAWLSPLLGGYAPPAGPYALPRLLLIVGATSLAIVVVAQVMAGEILRLYGETLARLEERDRVKRALAESEQRYRSLFDHNPDAVFSLDPAGRIVSANAAIEALTGYSVAEALALETAHLVAPDDHERIRRHFAEALAGRAQHVELALRHKRGRPVDAQVTLLPIRVDGRLVGVFGIAKDISARRAYEEQLQHQAFHDPLTGLPNRALFLDRLGHALDHARRRGEGVAVLFVDLDRFKVINDSLGHEAGDLLLIAVANALKGCLRPEDTAARLGGDEFTVLLERVADITAAVAVAERILRALQAPLALSGYDLVVTGSLGIALSTPERNDPVELMRQADVALYRAKAQGRGCYQVFDATMNARVLERLELEAELRRALEREEFVVHYQPKVALATGRLEGVEALVRWQHPERGLLPPAAFIALAEETGLIRPLGRWVLVEACRQARAWQARHPAGPPLVMAVNLTAPQFQQPHLAADIAAILAETGLPPHLLQLEITESVLMDDAAATLATLGALKRLGVQLAIDDFGTGYSSLAYLKRFPVDWLKVDRRFVEGLGTDAEDTAIVQAVVNLAAALKLAVTAEGVETADQVARLQALGCALGQGFYFARPLPAAAVDALLAAGRDCSPLAKYEVRVASDE